VDRAHAGEGMPRNPPRKSTSFKMPGQRIGADPIPSPTQQKNSGMNDTLSVGTEHVKRKEETN